MCAAETVKDAANTEDIDDAAREIFLRKKAAKGHLHQSYQGPQAPSSRTLTPPALSFPQPHLRHPKPRSCVQEAPPSFLIKVGERVQAVQEDCPCMVGVWTDDDEDRHGREEGKLNFHVYGGCHDE